MSRVGEEMEERLLNGSDIEQRRESLYLRKKIWSEVRKTWRIALPSTLFRVMSYGCIVVAQAFTGHSRGTGLAAFALLQGTFIRFIYGVMVSALRSMIVLAFFIYLFLSTICKSSGLI